MHWLLDIKVEDVVTLSRWQHCLHHFEVVAALTIACPPLPSMPEEYTFLAAKQGEVIADVVTLELQGGEDYSDDNSEDD
jgi:hypothetical protein